MNEIRQLEIDLTSRDDDQRTIEASISSEFPVQRWDGEEILDHSPGAVDLSRAPLPLIISHDNQKLNVGIVDNLRLAGKKLRGLLKFGERQEAVEIWRDVKAGIIRYLSVGYQIIQREEPDENGVYRVLKWMPYECSLVSVPADNSVGIGRNFHRKDRNTMENRDFNIYKNAENAKDPERAALRAMHETQEILELAKEHGMHELGNRAAAGGWGLKRFRDALLEEIGNRGSREISTGELDAMTAGTAEIGMSDRERGRYSWLKMIRFLADPTNPRKAEEAAFERECSYAVSDKTRKNPKGLFVPTDVLRHSPGMGRRDLNTQVDSAGGYLVKNQLAVGSFIDSLENQLVVKELGCTMIRDVEGDLYIPKKTAGGTAYWVGEAEDATESAQTLGQVALKPHTIAAYSDLTRRFVVQSSMDAEQFVVNDLAQRLALAIDLAAIAGDGAANEPLGILNTTGLGAKTLGTANEPSFGECCDIISEIATDNALSGRLAFTSNATIMGNMLQTAVDSGSGRFVLENGKIAGYPFLMSNQVTAKYLLFGNWQDLILAQWTGVDVNVDTASLSKSGGIRVVVMQDVDVALRHAESFAYGFKS